MRNGTQVLVAAVYGISGEGMSAANLALFHSIGETFASFGLPWLAAGDWNVEPKQLQEIDWFEQFQAAPLPQTGVEATCFAGQTPTYHD